jgi:hypothetical protein
MSMSSPQLFGGRASLLLRPGRNYTCVLPGDAAREVFSVVPTPRARLWISSAVLQLGPVRIR